jgi:hypothetical protein
VDHRFVYRVRGGGEDQRVEIVACRYPASLIRARTFPFSTIRPDANAGQLESRRKPPGGDELLVKRSSL